MLIRKRMAFIRVRGATKGSVESNQLVYHRTPKRYGLEQQHAFFVPHRQEAHDGGLELNQPSGVLVSMCAQTKHMGTSEPGTPSLSSSSSSPSPTSSQEHSVEPLQ